MLPKMVKETGAHSTDPQSPEDVQHLCDKCKPYAEAWTKMADKLWAERLEAKSKLGFNSGGVGYSNRNKAWKGVPVQVPSAGQF